MSFRWFRVVLGAFQRHFEASQWVSDGLTELQDPSKSPYNNVFWSVSGTSLNNPKNFRSPKVPGDVKVISGLISSVSEGITGVTGALREFQGCNRGLSNGFPGWFRWFLEYFKEFRKIFIGIKGRFGVPESPCRPCRRIFWMNSCRSSRAHSGGIY